MQKLKYSWTNKYIMEIETWFKYCCAAINQHLPTVDQYPIRMFELALKLLYKVSLESIFVVFNVVWLILIETFNFPIPENYFKTWSEIRKSLWEFKSCYEDVNFSCISYIMQLHQLHVTLQVLKDGYKYYCQVLEML